MAIEINCKSVAGGWQTQVTNTGYLFGPVFNAINDLWDWQRVNLTAPAKPRFVIRGARWFRKGAGHTITKVRIFRDGDLVHESRECAWGDGYLQMAADWLRLNGYPDAQGHTLWMTETLGAEYSVNDVQRERDL